MGEANRPKDVPEYQPAPRQWATHPPKKMLMTPWLVFWGGLFAYAIPTLVAAFFQLAFFHPPVSRDWAPLPTAADAWHGRQVYLSNGCVYCHSHYTRPQDVRQGLYYLYPRISLPGDFITTDSSPNIWGSARIGPDLSQEAGFHPRDWERAHFSDARYVTPNSIMPRFIFLSDGEVENLTTLLERWSGKQGLVRVAGQEYMKEIMLTANNMPPPPLGFQAEKLTMADVARMKMNAPPPVPGKVDGLPWPDPIKLNVVDRGYWLTGNPMPVTTYNLSRGRLLFQDMCIGCHGEGGSGDSRAARYLRPMPADFAKADDAASGNDTSPGDFYYRILRGIHGTAMENFGTRLRVADIWRVVLFLKTIPNGGLKHNELPTPEKYIQWTPPPPLLTYISKHPLSEAPGFVLKQEPSDPFMLEAMRVLNGMSPNDRFVLPGYGEISLAAAAASIRTRYQRMLDEGWRDYLEREQGDKEHQAPLSQKAELPTLLSRELR